MNSRTCLYSKVILASLLLSLGAVGLVHAQTFRSSLDAEAISKAAAVEATVKDDGVVRIGWKRTDVPVTVDGLPLPAPAGLGSWAAFKAMAGGEAGESVMVMGDTVVFEDEITPAMDAAFAHGLDVTALHNHFIFDRPPVFYMHIGGTGEAEPLAEGVKAVWDAIKEVRAERPKPANTFGDGAARMDGGFNMEELKEVFGEESGEPSETNGVVKFTFPREAKMHGMSFGGSMGLATWAAFTGSQEQATVDGDFAMTANEVQPVMRALRKANIHIVALHNHMIGEEPAYYFLHYWGNGPAEALATGVRSALEVQHNSEEEGEN